MAVRATSPIGFVRLWIGAVLVLALSMPARCRADEPPEIKVGVLAFRGAEQANADWGATLAYLSQALPHYRFKLVPGSTAFLKAAVTGHRVDFLITNPGQFFELQVEYGATGIATVQDMDGTPPSASVAAAVVVPAGRSDALRLNELDGVRFAAVAPDSFGFRMAWREFSDQGIDPSKHMSLVFVGFPSESVLAAIRSGKADAGVLRACLLEKLIADGSVQPNEFRVISRKPSGAMACQVSTRLYPGWPFVKVAQTSTEIARQVTDALLTMQPGSGDHVWTIPEDYQPVQDLYRSLKIGPYDRFRRWGMMELLWENRYWAALVLTAVLWWLIHVFRVEHLIKRRTLELQMAHEQARIRGEQMEHTVRLSLMGEMASSLAHEINQPLAAILNYARGCERRLENGLDMDGVQKGIRQIAVQAERAGGIVKRMRDFVRKHPSTQVPVNPSLILEDTLLLYEPTALGKDVAIEIDIPPILPLIRADRLQVEEVLLNLLQNAVEAVAGQDVQRVNVKVAVEDAALRVDVIDNGAGVSADAKDHLFEAFYTTKAEGLGLGLSLSRTIVEAHGGRLWAETGPHGGAIFSFTLPLADEAADV